VTDQAMARPIDILLIEDRPGDIVRTRQAFADHKVRNRLVVFDDGRQALAYLRREGPHADAVRPDLILLDRNLLDRNLPGADGRRLLTELAADPVARDIPIVVLTDSLAERETLRAQQLQVADYLCRPLDFSRLVDVVKRIESLAITVVRIP
jgi:CheY-like chemotaxis protein